LTRKIGRIGKIARRRGGVKSPGIRRIQQVQNGPDVKRVARPIRLEMAEERRAEKRQVADEVEKFVPHELVRESERTVDDFFVVEDQSVGQAAPEGQPPTPELGNVLQEAESARRRDLLEKSPAGEAEGARLGPDGRVGELNTIAQAEIVVGKDGEAAVAVLEEERPNDAHGLSLLGQAFRPRLDERPGQRLGAAVENGDFTAIELDVQAVDAQNGEDREEVLDCLDGRVAGKERRAAAGVDFSRVERYVQPAQVRPSEHDFPGGRRFESQAHHRSRVNADAGERDRTSDGPLFDHLNIQYIPAPAPPVKSPDGADPWRGRRPCGKIRPMKTELEEILEKVSKKQISPEVAFLKLKEYPYQDLGFAKIDHHREARRGFPEIIFGQGKTPEQVSRIAREIVKRKHNLLITRLDASVFRRLKREIPACRYDRLGRIAYLKQKPPIPGKGTVVVMTAGTSDIPVAEEAALTCELMGNTVDRVYDVGVAGLHRLFGEMDKIRKARIIIAVAGMEGALPSVVAGLVDVPIIAVPTSVGYGASLQGISALLAMLNSCPGGVAVVNIDNGFGAGHLASLINHI
jgi:NCAIR mutase (PurE)-related protein